MAQQSHTTVMKLIMKANPALKNTPLRPVDPAGVGLRDPHIDDFLNETPNIGWIEVHPENYFGQGIGFQKLEKIRQNLPLSFHSVGLSLGSAHAVNLDHARQIKALADILEPFQFSDHASWSASGNAHLNDLLPLPYNQETLDVLCRNVDAVQTIYGQPMLVENPSTYVAFGDNEMEEPEFLNQLAQKTGCSLLLDLNNIHVQAHNHNFDAYSYLDQIDAPIGEMHLAGPSDHVTHSGETILIDTHSSPVRDTVWDLYAHAVRRFGETLSLIEWDMDIPPLSRLMQEAETARKIMQDTINKGDHAAA